MKIYGNKMKKWKGKRDKLHKKRVEKLHKKRVEKLHLYEFSPPAATLFVGKQMNLKGGGGYRNAQYLPML